MKRPSSKFRHPSDPARPPAEAAGPRWLILAACALFGGLMALTPIQPYELHPPAKIPGNQGQAATPDLPRFEDRTLAMGLTFSHQQGEEALGGLDETLGPGACALDYDNDGWMDLFLVNGSGQTRYYGKPHWWQRGQGNALFHNQAGQGFAETTGAAGLSKPMWGMGCVSADFDDDGDPDLWVTSRSGNVLYRNDGRGGFVDVTAKSGVRGDGWSTTATVADYDGDGRLDVYVANYVNLKRGAPTYEAGTQFTGGLPVSFSGELYESQPNKLYRNLGGMRFQDATETAGVGNREGRTLAAAWLDADADRRPDLLAVNDKGAASNALFLNTDGQTFHPAGLGFGLNSSLGHHGVAQGDLDNDLAQDLVVASAREQLPLALLRQPGRPDRVYEDQARTIGIAKESDSGLAGWTPGLHDFDRDGRLDLFMANGLAMPDPDTGRVPQGQPKKLWLNRGASQFEDVSDSVGTALQDTQSARGAAFADFDNDGDMDVYVAHNNDLGQLLVNTPPPGRHWLGVRLAGRGKNRDAVGARITLTTQDGAQARVIVAGTGFASDSDRRALFGLGTTDRVETLRVDWPDGGTDDYREPPIDRYLLVRQGAERIETLAAKAPANPAPPWLPDADPIDRRRYLRLLVKVSGIDAALPALRLAQSDADPKTRLSVLRRLEKHKTAAGLELLTAALDDPDPRIVEKAVRVLCDYEDETSVRWLLRAFRHPAPEVRTALAECFTYFFQEEEAVVHRKYLALPALIHLLDDPNDGARIAAMRALANAERYRAVDPLLESLRTTRGEVQAEAARALGLIREKKAGAGLLAVLAAPDSSAPARAHALIALKRLDHPGSDRLLGDFVAGRDNFAALSPTDRLATLEAALTDGDDGVVLNRRDLLGHVLAWAKGASGTRSNPEEARTLAAVLDLCGLPEARPLLGSLATHAEPSVRRAAWLALWRAQPERRVRLAEAGLRDAAAGVRLAVLEALRQPDFPRELPGTSLLDNAKHPDTRLAALRVMHLARDRRADIVRHQDALLRDPAQPDAAKLAVLESLALAKGGAPDLPDALFSAADPTLRGAALACWSARHPTHLPGQEPPMPFARLLDDPDPGVQREVARRLAERPEAWAKQAIEQRLRSASAPPGLRRALLRRYPVAGPGGRELLLGIARDPGDPLRYQAIRRLARLDDPALDAPAWGWLRDPAEPLNIRLAAARRLASRHGGEALEALRPFPPSWHPDNLPIDECGKPRWK